MYPLQKKYFVRQVLHRMKHRTREMYIVSHEGESHLESLTILNEKVEALKGARKGQYSIRINDQWRICFVWSNGNADAVEIVDYH